MASSTTSTNVAMGTNQPPPILIPLLRASSRAPNSNLGGGSPSGCTHFRSALRQAIWVHIPLPPTSLPSNNVPEGGDPIAKELNVLGLPGALVPGRQVKIRGLNVPRQSGTSKRRVEQNSSLLLRQKKLAVFPQSTPNSPQNFCFTHPHLTHCERTSPHSPQD